MRKTLQFDVYGQRMVFEYFMDGWKAYYLGKGGKRRPADITIPSHYTVRDIVQNLDDMFHEAVTKKQPVI